MLLDSRGIVQGQLIQSWRYIMFFQGPWKSSGWHWSSGKEASSGWFMGRMDLKSMPNGFRATTTPDEKLPLSKQQPVSESAAAVVRGYLWRSRCTRTRWFQVTIQIGREVEEKMVWDLNQKLSLNVHYRCLVNPYQNANSAFPLHSWERDRKCKESKERKIFFKKTIFHGTVLYWDILLKSTPLRWP